MNDYRADGQLGPDRFTEKQQTEIRSEIGLAMEGAAKGFDSEGAGLEYAYENIFSIANKYDIEISFNYRLDGEKWYLSNAGTLFYNNASSPRDIHTHQTSNFWSAEDMYKNKAWKHNRYLMNDTGIYRFRGPDWRSDWYAAKNAGRPLPSSNDYHAKYGGNDRWAKVYVR
ncbi:hypothetical protein [uncultured Microbulbifer sp.]|uniref:hypothetical protein n=1 Tax=uncultured Microbulbifer sp. TaxID=348147 RepID=UPI0025DDA0E5|nr:hypothetical protein [uncultured Microbulbifer sp.]